MSNHRAVKYCLLQANKARKTQELCNVALNMFFGDEPEPGSPPTQEDKDDLLAAAHLYAQRETNDLLRALIALLHGCESAECTQPDDDSGPSVYAVPLSDIPDALKDLMKETFGLDLTEDKPEKKPEPEPEAATAD